MYIKTSDQPELELGFGGWRCNWGLHICGLYETEEERDEIVMGFLRQGIEDGDLQMYVPAERTEEEFRDKFASICPHCAEKSKDHNVMQIFSAKELYYPDGLFSPRAMDKGLNAFYKESQKNGERHIRATAEMVWALEAVPGIENLMVYESRLNYFIPGKPWISVCLYNVTKFDGKTIMDVLRTHPFTINKGIITENPFFINPDEWLAENAPEFLDS